MPSSSAKRRSAPSWGAAAPPCNAPSMCWPKTDGLKFDRWARVEPSMPMSSTTGSHGRPDAMACATACSARRLSSPRKNSQTGPNWGGKSRYARCQACSGMKGSFRTVPASRRLHSRSWMVWNQTCLRQTPTSSLSSQRHKMPCMKRSARGRKDP